MSKISQDRLYSKEHEWVLDLGKQDRFRVGITDHAQDQLGDIVFVELLEPGTEVTAMEAVGVVESVKTVSDLFCPAAGVILEVNGALEEAPELLNQSPYDEGWIFEMSISDPAGMMEDLLDAKGYAALIAAP